MAQAVCKLCGKELVVHGLGRLPLPCGHDVHELCAHHARLEGSAGACPTCGCKCEDLMGADAMFEKASSHHTKTEFKEAARILTAILDSQDHAQAAGLLGHLLVHGHGVSKDLPRGLKLLQLAMKSGNLDATCSLGCVHAEGLGVKKDMKKMALKLWKQALDAGCKNAAGLLGGAYQSGDGVPKDEDRALEYYEVAVRAGIPIDPDAATMMGLTCLKGKLKNRDPILGLLLLEIGHSGGNPAASMTLWDHHKRSDAAGAVKYLEAAHWGAYAHGNPLLSATWSLGLQYMSDHAGMQKDYGKGLQLLLVAWDAGYPEALTFLPQLIVGSSSEQLSEMAAAAKFIFAPDAADVRHLTVSQLKDRAENLWSRMMSGTLKPSDMPSDMIADINAKQGEAVLLGKPPSFSVHIIQFSRHPSMLRAALLEGIELKACREALAAEGFSPEQPSGAKVFVKPSQFDSVLSATESLDLKPWHVVVSDEFEKAVDEAVKSLPSKAQVREKQRCRVPAGPCASCGAINPRFTCKRCNLACYCSKRCQQQDWRGHRKVCMPLQAEIDDSGFPVVLKRSFLEVPIQTSLRSSPASGKQTKSTTDADPRKGPNPRNA